MQVRYRGQKRTNAVSGGRGIGLNLCDSAVFTNLDQDAVFPAFGGKCLICPENRHCFYLS
jgi:hypothetical protein